MSNNDVLIRKIIKNIIKESAEGDLYSKVLEFTKSRDTISVSAIQRQFRIGYSEAANYLQTLERSKIISPGQPSGARDVLVKESIDFNRISRKVNRIMAESFALGSYGYGEQDVYGKWESIDRDLRSLGWVRQKAKSSSGGECMLTEPVWVNPMLFVYEESAVEREKKRGKTGPGFSEGWHPKIVTRMIKDLRGASWISQLIFDAEGWLGEVYYKDKLILQPSETEYTVQGHPTLEKSLEALMNVIIKDNKTGQSYKARYWFEKLGKTSGQVERPQMPKARTATSSMRSTADAGARAQGSFGLGNKIASWFGR